MGAIANNIRYGFLIVVICNPKMLQPNYDLDNSLRSRLPNNTCNYGYNFSTRSLQELDVHNKMKDVETQYYVTLCWWLYSSADTNDGFYNLSKH